MDGWKKTYFGNDTRVTDPAAKKTDFSVIVRNVPLDYTECEIETGIKDSYLSLTDVVRFNKNHTPMPVVKISFSDVKDRDTLVLQRGITIRDMYLPVQEFVTLRKPTQCFRCQEFGHISTSCTKKQKCGKCASDHSTKDCNSLTIQCANCDAGHNSSSTKCPVFLKAAQKLVVH